MKPLRRLVRKAFAAVGIEISVLKNPGENAIAGATFSWRSRSSGRMLRGAVVKVEHPLGEARFFITNEEDHIQRQLADGRFYEEEELEIIGRHFSGGTFVDIGSNIGNHAVFAGKFLGATRLVCVEPNPAALAMLEINLALNGLAQCSCIKALGLADVPGTATIDVPKHNLGAGRLEFAEGTQGGDMQISTGDNELTDEQPAFIKIDTEGAELLVLKGMQETLRTHAPVLFIEVEPANEAEIIALLVRLGYGLREEFTRYPPLKNLLFSK